MENRFAPLTLPRWEADEDACSLLASFAASFPLRKPSLIASAEMASYLLTRSEGTIGELAHLLTDAAVAAIESGEEAINQRLRIPLVGVGTPLSTYSACGLPFIGHTASTPSRSSHGRLSVAACARHSPTEVADGASNVTTRPTTHRLATSIAAVRYGRPIGSRCRSSTTITSTGV
ncbi:hypothetical protein [Streptomyces mirabilis]|uniref:hypothetical protein n=1 Tax=Streptomyces mirabilis TaxID=68239 RepID=UPI003D9E39C6